MMLIVVFRYQCKCSRNKCSLKQRGLVVENKNLTNKGKKKL